MVLRCFKVGVWGRVRKLGVVVLVGGLFVCFSSLGREGGWYFFLEFLFCVVSGKYSGGLEFFRGRSCGWVWCELCLGWNWNRFVGNGESSGFWRFSEEFLG